MLAAGLALLVAMSCAACAGGGSTGPSSRSTSSTSASSSANPTNISNPSKTPESTAVSTTRPTKPVAHCPVIKAATTPQVPLDCTSATVIGAAAARVGLKRDSDTRTIVPVLYLLSYTRTVLIPVAYRREVNIFHYANGAVASLLCSGVVARTLDPALVACLDVGPSTRTDRAAVRAWALRAEATIAKSAKAQPALTSGKLSFVACSDPSFLKTSDKTIAFEMNLYVEHSGSRPAPADCAR
jgi:hypothetical protein